MRVGLLAYLMHSGADYRAAGVSTYARELLSHLAQAEPAHEYLAFHGSDSRSVPGVQSVVSPLPTVRAPIRIAWEQLGFPWQALAAGIDVVHGMVNVVPLLARQPSVVTVHDLAFLRHPERFPRAKTVYLRSAVHASVRRSRHIIAVSESTRRDVVELLAVPEECVTVIYPGVASTFRPLIHEDVESFRQSVFGGRPYILHVGTLEPRKNVDILVRAFARVRASSGLPHVLALVGARGWMYKSLFELVSQLGLEDQVHFVEYVPAHDLPFWYNGADLFAYPSAYEGFGLPVVEAMACGVPVVTSASSSLSELAGDACLTVEPGSPESLQVAMTRILESPDLQSRLREAGRMRAGRFSWERTARATIDIYERLADLASVC